MDDERQAGLARRRGMGAEQLRLARPRAVVVVEIEPGLADADDFGDAPRERDERGAVGVGLGRGLVRMDADRAPDVGVALGDRPYPLELGRAACRW